MSSDGAEMVERLPPIRYRTYIGAKPSRVYDTVATGDGWSSWFTTRARIDARPGGTYDGRSRIRV